MKKMIIVFLSVLILPLAAHAEVKGEGVDYTVNGAVYKGYLAYDDASEARRPGVLVVPEWWGVTDYVRRRARMLAELGYTAFVVDMYGAGKTADNPTDAGAYSQAVYADPAAARARFTAAMDNLKGFRLTDPGRMAAIGYCFGGAIVLNMALDGVPLDGVVSFHASLPNPPEHLDGGRVKASLLIEHGGADKFTPDEKIAGFKDALTKAGVDYRFDVYAGALHSFTNPAADAMGKKFNLPIAYDPEADSKSWSAMRDFLRKVFQS